MMSRVSKLQKLKEQVIKKFYNLTSNKKVFSIKQMKYFLDEIDSFFQLPESVSNPKILDLFEKEGIIKEINLNFKSYNYIRYIVDNPSIFQIITSLSRTVYLSHYTAMYLHNLTEQIPKKIYCNNEQREKNNSEKTKFLDQENINNAFKRKMRKTNNIFEFNGDEIFLLNGKFTNNIGIIDMTYNNEEIRISSIERTLIDIAVRPDYSGGPIEIIKAYRNARGKFSINKLNDYLNKIDYIYPYHQSIGFYLERAGNYNESTIKIISNKEIKNDFFLTYGENFENLDYDKKWRLYFPKGL
ncbi:MAG: hypothetical protein K2X69_17445 [Silvanigrellaceae bacterium]|nr:hypothetical protein [Silvanigrellaceae bacterium]